MIWTFAVCNRIRLVPRAVKAASPRMTSTKLLTVVKLLTQCRHVAVALDVFVGPG
jgi:hypothetical protein